MASLVGIEGQFKVDESIEWNDTRFQVWLGLVNNCQKYPDDSGFVPIKFGVIVNFSAHGWLHCRKPEI